MTTENTKQYKTLGEMARSGAYDVLLDKLLQYENTEDMEILQEVSLGSAYSELDHLLFNVSRFAIDKKFEKETPPIPGEVRKLCDNFLEVIDVILRNGANPNTPINNGITPFMMACTVDNPDFMKKLIENEYTYEDLKTGNKEYKKADLDKGDGRGNRPLYYATMTQSVNVMEALVKEYGVNPDFKSFLSDSKTVMHLVCENIAYEIIPESDGLTFKDSENQNKNLAIDKLIDLNANPNIRDDWDNLPQEVIPAFDPDIHNEGDISEEELKVWDDTYNKIDSYRLNYTPTTNNKQKKSI